MVTILLPVRPPEPEVDDDDEYEFVDPNAVPTRLIPPDRIIEIPVGPI